MAFVVEDGTGLETATAYIDTTFADSYFTDRGDASWTGTPQVKQQAIIRATDFIEATFGRSFIGVPLTETQALHFPHVLGEIPVQLKKACAEYAKRALAASLVPDPTTDPSGKEVLEYEKTVGPITKRYKFASGYSVLSRYPAADAILRPLLRSINTVSR